jgi:hypothetical protein
MSIILEINYTIMSVQYNEASSNKLLLGGTVATECDDQPDK